MMVMYSACCSELKVDCTVYTVQVAEEFNVQVQYCTLSVQFNVQIRKTNSS